MKRILVIGSTSKIAKRIKEELGHDYELVQTSRGKHTRNPSNTLDLDLSSRESINKFIESQKDTPYYGVFVLASSYNADSLDSSKYYEQALEDFSTNVLGPIAIVRALSYEQPAHVFLFGDSGTSHPKEGYTSYTTSKNLLSHHGRTIAVELAPKGVSVILFELGPTNPVSIDDKAVNQYYSRNLLKVADPTDGLVKLSRFLLENNNVSITGSAIQYDGGAYIKRNT